MRVVFCNPTYGSISCILLQDYNDQNLGIIAARSDKIELGVGLAFKIYLAYLLHVLRPVTPTICFWKLYTLDSLAEPDRLWKSAETGLTETGLGELYVHAS